MASLGDLIVRVGADIDNFVSSMSTVADRMNKTADQVEKRLKSIESVMGGMATAGATMSAAITLPLEEIARRSLEVAATFEQTQIAFQTLMGSTTKANETLKDLYAFAAQTPFQIQGILQGSRQLTAMQVSAKDLIPTMKTLGDAASGLGLGQAGFERLIYHFGQIKSEGAIDKLIIREMGQMGINAGQMLADGLGKTVPEVLKMVHAKAIDAETAIRLLREGMDRQFGGMMTAQMGTLIGQFTNLKDNVTFAMDAIGKVLLPLAKVLVDMGNQLTGFAKSAAEAFGNLPAPAQGFLIAMAALIPVIATALTGIGALGLAGIAIVTGIAPIAAALGLTTIAFGSWVAAIGAAVAALVGLGVWVYKEWPIITAAVKAAWSDVLEFWSPIWKSIKDFLFGIWSSISTHASTVFGGIKGFITSVGDHIIEYLKVVGNMASQLIDAVSNKLAKIPGLGNMVADVKQAIEAAKAHQELLDNLKRGGNRGAMGNAKPHLPTELGGGEKGGKSSTEDTFHSKPIKWDERLLTYALYLDKLKAKWSQTKDFLTDLSDKVAAGPEFAKMTAQWSIIPEQAKRSVESIKKTFQDLFKDVATPITALKDAFESLGIEATAALNQQAKDAQNAYLMIQRSGTATAEQIGAAWIKAEESRQKAVEGGGGSVSRRDKLNLSMKKEQKGDGLIDSLGKNSFTAFNESFNRSIQGLLNGTATFRQAWGGMVQSMYQAWTGTLAQMATQWIAHQIQKLALNILTNAGIVASNAGAAAATNAISFAQHMKEMFRAATLAAARTYAAVAAIPLVGPFLAPVAAAVAFAGVLALGAVSAERGADLPNYNTMGVLHPREMVLPREQADVIRGLAKNGGTGGGDTTHYSGDMHINYNAKPGETLTHTKLLQLSKEVLRNRPGLKLRTV